MLTDVQIEKYLFKYAQRHESFVQLIGEITAQRIQTNSGVTSVNTPFSLKEAFKREQDLNKIKKAKLELITAQVADLGNDLAEIVHSVYNDSRPLLNTDEPFFIPKDIKKSIEQHKLELFALIQTPLFSTKTKLYKPEELYSVMVNDAFLNNPLMGKIKSSRNALNRFYNASSVFSYKDTTNDEVRIVSAINSLRMNVLSGIKDIIDKTTKFIVKRVKNDGVELSAHICPAPDHAPVQGRQFSLEEFEKMQSGQDCVDVKGNVYSGFPRQIGQWNCRHYTKPIKIGKTEPEHSEGELQKILSDNEKGYTTSDGKHHTLYECTQIQRGYERSIREYKEKYLVSKYLRDNTKMKEYRAKVGDLTTQYKTFSEGCGLPIMYERIRIKDY